MVYRVSLKRFGQMDIRCNNAGVDGVSSVVNTSSFG